MKTGTIVKGLFLLAVILFSSCEYRNCIDGNGNYVIEPRTVTGTFVGIELEGSYNVFVSRDTVVSIEVEADENVLPFVLTRVRAGRLLIDSEEQCIRTKRTINVYVSMPDIKELILDGSGLIEVDTIDVLNTDIQLNGSGEIFIDDLYADACDILLDGSGLITVNRLTSNICKVNHNSSGKVVIKDAYAEDLNFNLDGSGAIEVYRIDAPNLEADLGGSGHIILEGGVDFAIMSITGSGNIDAFNLIQRECDAYISGSGSIYTFVTLYLTVDIPGSGMVYFKGNPTIYLVEDTPEELVVPS